VAEPQDELVFEVARGDRRSKSVPAGQGESEVLEILHADSPWIEVDGRRYLNRDHVISVEVRLASDSSPPIY
jgi:hypothetical protein